MSQGIGKRWTTEEDFFLKENFKTSTYLEMGSKLSRTKMAIIHRCRILGLFRANRHHLQPGEKYGRLTVISKINKSMTGQCAYFLCKCDCGTIKEFRGSSLRCGNTQSCGCLLVEVATQRGGFNKGYPGETSYKSLESRCKKGAKSRGLDYSLTTEQFVYLITQNCYWDGKSPSNYNAYTRKDGSKPSNHSHIKDEWVAQQLIKVNGIDRLNSDLGYIIENCVPCCPACNTRKMDSSPEEFLGHMQRILDHQASKIKKMSLRDILESAQAISLSSRLAPDEAAIWHRYCRTYSKQFSEPLSQVLLMDPLTVLTAVFSDQMDNWEIEEHMEDIIELLSSLSDPEYDIKKERAIKEEMRQIQEREEQRLKEGKAIHPSLEKDKRVISKELPKSGGLNMDALRRLNNQDKEG